MPAFVFPVVGPVTYTDDWGAPRGGHSHQGNDLLAPRLAPVVATEDGRIKFWTSSARAGCMLYLYGDSGTTYLYIHLNNDLTGNRDNRGSCVAGTAYWQGLKDGQRVKAGQPIGYNGDSGDAEGTYHLHFEVHPGDGGAVNPYPYLQSARRLLFVSPRGATVTLALSGSFISTAPGLVKVRVDTLRVLPAGPVLTRLARPIVLTVPPDALVQRIQPNGIAGTAAQLSSARRGQAVSVLTLPVATSLDVQVARDGILSASRILLL